jgi:hypothetical protein
MSVRLFRLSVLMPVLGLALLAAGCTNKIVICPVAAILADTASVTVMRPGTQPDLANELYTVRLTDAGSDCTINTRPAEVKSSLTLTFVATRTPTRDAARYSVPYFVAVTENAKIFAKRAYVLNVEFAPGAATAVIKQAPEDISLINENGKLPWNYQLMAGFQLTPAQIEYNKTRSRYLP